MHVLPLHNYCILVVLRSSSVAGIFACRLAIAMQSYDCNVPRVLHDSASLKAVLLLSHILIKY